MRTVPLESASTSMTNAAENYPHLAFPPKYVGSASCKTIDMKQWARENPREYAIFARFEKAKQGYLNLAKEVERIQSSSHCNNGQIERNIEFLEHKYCWMQQFAAENPDIVLELPLRQHTYRVPPGTKI